MYRVLFYIDDLTAGGAEKVLCNLVNNMDPSLFDITVHTTYESDIQNLNKADNIHYRYVYKNKTKLSRLLYRIEAQLGLFYQFHLKGIYDLEVAYLECGPTKVMAASTNKKAAHIAWIHCDLQNRFSNMEKFAGETAQFYKNYDKVVCVSKACKQSYDKYFSDCSPSVILHNVIDDLEIINKSEAQLNLELKKDRLTFVAVGRQSYEKNYMMLLRIHKQLIDEGYDHSLWMIGDGPEANTLKQYVHDNKLDSSVRFFGFQKNPYPIMKEADVFVSSSLYEGYSTAIIEALVLGLPVITTNCSGMYEILQNSEFGMITDNNELFFKQGMISMISDSDLRKSYQYKAKMRAEQLTGRTAAQHAEELFVKVIQEYKKC